MRTVEHRPQTLTISDNRTTVIHDLFKNKQMYLRINWRPLGQAMLNYMVKFLKTTPVFLFFSICMILWQDDISLDFERLPIYQYLFLETLIALFFSMAIPVVISKVVFKTNLKDLGLIAPKMTLSTVLLTVMAFMFFIPSTYLLLNDPNMKAFYSFKQLGLYEFILLITLTPIYYFTEEFFFRGFLFFSLWKRLKWHSFWITDIIFTLSHIGKPGMEILFCIPVSLAFNVLTLYTKSIYPAVLVHSCMGIFCIIFSNLT